MQLKNPFKKVVEIHHQYDMLPPMDWATATSETALEYYRSLTRLQLLELADRDIPEVDQFLDEYFKVYDEKFDMWPTDKEVWEVVQKIPSSWSGKKSIEHQLAQLEQRTEGMQKKLDKIVKAFETSTISMSGKEYLKS